MSQQLDTVRFDAQGLGLFASSLFEGLDAAFDEQRQSLYQSHRQILETSALFCEQILFLGWCAGLIKMRYTTTTTTTTTKSTYVSIMRIGHGLVLACQGCIHTKQRTLSKDVLEFAATQNL
jgi:hypothetical protein